MESIKKMSLSAVEDRLGVYEMEEIQAGSGKYVNCSSVTGAMCTATIILAFSPLFCLSAATGYGCALGLVGC